MALTTKRKAEILQSLEQEGRLTTRGIIDFARPRDSELHEAFEWENRVAGPKWRLHQAAQMIREYKFRVVVSNVTLDLPVYVRDRSTEQKGTYRRLDLVRHDEEAAHTTMVDAMSRVTNALARAKSLGLYLRFKGELDEMDGLANGIMDDLENGDQPGGEA